MNGEELNCKRQTDDNQKTDTANAATWIILNFFLYILFTSNDVAITVSPKTWFFIRFKYLSSVQNCIWHFSDNTTRLASIYCSKYKHQQNLIRDTIEWYWRNQKKYMYKHNKAFMYFISANKRKQKMISRERKKNENFIIINFSIQILYRSSINNSKQRKWNCKTE